MRRVWEITEGVGLLIFLLIGVVILIVCDLFSGGKIGREWAEAEKLMNEAQEE